MTEDKDSTQAQAKDDLGKDKHTELSEEELLNVSGGTNNCVAGSHYKTVTLAMRKSGGDPKASGGGF